MPCVAMILCALAPPAPQAAGGPFAAWRQQAVRIGDAPLLFARAPAASDAGGGFVHSVVAPDVDPGLIEWLRAPSRLHPLHRVDQRRVLFASDDAPCGLVLADLSLGTATLVPGSEAQLFGDVHGSDLFVVAGDGRDGAPALLEVALPGVAAREVCRLPPRTVASFVRVRCSPDGKHVAWSSAASWVEGEEAMAHLDGSAAPRLVVVERASGRVVLERAVESIDVSPLSSQMPSLEFAWVDDERLRVCESEPGEPPLGRLDPQLVWVDVEVATGREVARHGRGPVGLGHERPRRRIVPETSIERVGWFEQGTVQLWFAGHPEPIVDRAGKPGLRDTRWSIAPDGGWCVLERTRDGVHELLLLTGASRERRLLASGAFELAGWAPEIESHQAR